jgi:hypothetical protein
MRKLLQPRAFFPILLFLLIVANVLLYSYILR